jgi:hypothetical protein
MRSGLLQPKAEMITSLPLAAAQTSVSLRTLPMTLVKFSFFSSISLLEMAVTLWPRSSSLLKMGFPV